MSKKPTIGELTDRLFRLREAKKAKQKEADELGYQQKQLEEYLMEQLDAQDTRKGEGKLASCSISTSIVPTVSDWAALERFILRHKDISLLEKRVRATRYRELLEERPRGVPGTEPFEKRTVNIRKLS